MVIKPCRRALRASLSGKDLPDDVKTRLLNSHEETVLLQEQVKTLTDKLNKAKQVKQQLISHRSTVFIEIEYLQFIKAQDKLFKEEHAKKGIPSVTDFRVRLTRCTHELPGQLRRGRNELQIGNQNLTRRAHAAEGRSKFPHCYLLVFSSNYFRLALAGRSTNTVPKGAGTYVERSSQRWHGLPT
jgi:hypothetical protein